MLYGQDRQELREIYFRAWRKHTIGEALDGVEPLIVAVAQRHPEYHSLLETPDSSAGRDWLPELGDSNPFLHMGMHIAIEEQLALDSPAGVRLHFARLCRQVGEEHAAQHRMMECLGETLWRAGRDGSSPDNRFYLDCLQQAIRTA